jgi:hypothetical protein
VSVDGLPQAACVPDQQRERAIHENSATHRTVTNMLAKTDVALSGSKRFGAAECARDS